TDIYSDSDTYIHGTTSIVEVIMPSFCTDNVASTYPTAPSLHAALPIYTYTVTVVETGVTSGSATSGTGNVDVAEDAITVTATDTLGRAHVSLRVPVGTFMPGSS